MPDMIKNSQNQKIAVELIDIENIDDRLIKLILKNGGTAIIRRDQAEIWPGRAYIEKWLFDRILGDD